MTKRIQKKRASIKNKARCDACLKQIQQAGFKILQKTYKNGYFLFDFGENSVCHFKLKAIPDWRFGIWLDSDGTYEIFGDHRDLIDKFKPSRTYVSHSSLAPFIQELQAIREHPYFHFVKSMIGDDAETMTREAIEINYQTHQQEVKQRQFNYLADKQALFQAIQEVLLPMDNVQAVGLTDGEIQGLWYGWRRYKMRIIIDETITEEQGIFLTEQSQQLLETLNQTQKTKEHGARLDGLYDEEKDLAPCHYVFNSNESGLNRRVY